MLNPIIEKINKNLGLVAIIFMCIIIILSINLQIKVNNLNLQVEEYIEDVNLKDEEIINKVENLSRQAEEYIGSTKLKDKEIISKVEGLSNEMKLYSQVKIGRDQFTEIYMQLQELP